ncbi:MAG: hypothetical protein CMQ16_09005 [Gammaproteobacteria bacterium]|nr:hypothetical protein [Gammaproteobacteria bacterium]
MRVVANKPQANRADVNTVLIHHLLVSKNLEHRVNPRCYTVYIDHECSDKSISDHAISRAFVPPCNLQTRPFFVASIEVADSRISRAPFGAGTLVSYSDSLHRKIL